MGLAQPFEMESSYCNCLLQITSWGSQIAVTKFRTLYLWLEWYNLKNKASNTILYHGYFLFKLPNPLKLLYTWWILDYLKNLEVDSIPMFSSLSFILHYNLYCDEDRYFISKCARKIRVWNTCYPWWGFSSTFIYVCLNVLSCGSQFIVSIIKEISKKECKELFPFFCLLLFQRINGNCILRWTLHATSGLNFEKLRIELVEI